MLQHYHQTKIHTWVIQTYKSQANIDKPPSQSSVVSKITIQNVFRFHAWLQGCPHFSDDKLGKYVVLQLGKHGTYISYRNKARNPISTTKYKNGFMVSCTYIYSTTAVFHDFILVLFQLIHCHYIACCISFTFKSMLIMTMYKYC